MSSVFELERAGFIAESGIRRIIQDFGKKVPSNGAQRILYMPSPPVDTIVKNLKIYVVYLLFVKSGFCFKF